MSVDWDVSKSRRQVEMHELVLMIVDSIHVMLRKALPRYGKMSEMVSTVKARANNVIC